ncbi:MAG: hypothetical protein K8R46_01015, partial [Pirellulales bacterium]|nr:hypothetical protein [Pirellulales bacterium]
MGTAAEGSAFGAMGSGAAFSGALAGAFTPGTTLPPPQAVSQPSPQEHLPQRQLRLPNSASSNSTTGRRYSLWHFGLQAGSQVGSQAATSSQVAGQQVSQAFAQRCLRNLFALQGLAQAGSQAGSQASSQQAD